MNRNASITVKHRALSRGRRDTWIGGVVGVGLAADVILECNHRAVVPVHTRTGNLVTCPTCTEAEQRAAARREQSAPKALRDLRARNNPHYADELERLARLQAAHRAEQASGRPGVGVD